MSNTIIKPHGGKLCSHIPDKGYLNEIKTDILQLK